jgi:MerR family transcriptional regulator, light-induced transcriptional regulator
MPDGVSGPTDARLTVAAVARRLGVAPATLRTWDRRYGLGPTLHTAGAHRRYSRSDIARLEAMRRLVLDGVAPADAARIALHQELGDGPDRPPPGPSGRLSVPDPPPAGAPVPTGGGAGGPGGRVLALPGASAEVRGLARAAMALDAGSVRGALERSVREQGVIPAWEDMLRPLLVAVGERWAATGEGIEVEHLLAETATGVLRGVTDAPEPRNGRPVLLACTPGELHSLPLSALAAALSERGTGVRLLGGSLPVRALAAAVRRTGPAALMVWAQQPEHADVTVFERLPLLRPPVAVLAGGIGWLGRPLPTRVTYASNLTAAVALIGRAVGS